MTLAEGIAAVILLSLIGYVLLGGADFGGGVWDLFATGPRARAQREVIAGAIGPIWEANHVWMIVAVVLLFTAFPPAFAVIMTALHIPVSIMLVGIVLRGTSFVFRKFEPVAEDGGSRWQRTFAISSLVTPVMIGVVLGAVSTTRIGWEDGVVTGGFVAPWMGAFPWSVGLFTLALFAFLAACYLPLETGDPDLRDDFRRRGLASGAAVGVLALLVGGLASSGAAPHLGRYLVADGAGRLTGVLGSLALGTTMIALHRRAFVVARLGAVATAIVILAGWGVGQYPWLVGGAITIEAAAAPRVTLEIVAWILGLGGVLLVPAYVYLVRTFKGQFLVARD